MNFVDKKLIKKAKAGDRQAFSELMYHYKDKIYNVAFKMLNNAQEAEDIVQETFLRVYANLEKYDEQHKFSTWIFRIATNLCIDRIRKKKADFSIDDKLNNDEGLDWHSILPSKNRGPEEEVILNEQHSIIQQAIINLPAKYRVIMVLRYVQDLSIQEISEIAQLSISTVKTRLYRGREYLRKQLLNNNIIIERGGQYEMS